MGIDPVANALSAIDYKFNQALELGNSGANILPGGFKFGDPLSPSLVTTLNLNSGLVGKDKVANLEIFSNQAVVVREALRAPLGGSIHITAEAVTVGADIESPSGSITLNAHRNDIDPVPPPLNVTVADGITLSARGVWVNELPPAPVGSGDVALVDGGKITLAADDNLALGQGSLLDVTAGGRLRADGRGRVIAGNAGEISLSGHTLSGFNENVRGFGITGKGLTSRATASRLEACRILPLTLSTWTPGFSHVPVSPISNLRESRASPYPTIRGSGRLLSTWNCCRNTGCSRAAAGWKISAG